MQSELLRDDMQVNRSAPTSGIGYEDLKKHTNGQKDNQPEQQKCQVQKLWFYVTEPASCPEPHTARHDGGLFSHIPNLFLTLVLERKGIGLIILAAGLVGERETESILKQTLKWLTGI